MELAENFIFDLKNSILLTENKNTYKPSPTYKPSSLKCIRNMYFQMVGAEVTNPKTDPCFVNVCNVGTDMHIRIQKQIEDMKINGMDCEYLDVADYIKENNIPNITIKGKSGMETRLHQDELNMAFMCDGIIKYKGKLYVLEIKTEASRKWLNRTDVDVDHRNQAIAYSYSLGIPDVLFLYINRDFLDMKSYIYSPTQEEINHVINLIKECDSYVEKTQVPPKPDISGRVCQYCEYRKICKDSID